jgi:hypothetical protein
LLFILSPRGLHFNGRGKQLFSHEITYLAYSVLYQRTVRPIIVGWRNKSLLDNKTVTKDSEMEVEISKERASIISSTSTDVNQNEVSNRTSTHNTKLTITRSDDF